jgi:polyphosphate kinase
MPKKRVYIGSTEPGARKIRERIEKTRNVKPKKPASPYDSKYDDLMDSEQQREATEEGLQQLRKLREAQRRRREALEKQRQRQKKDKK